MSRWDRYGSMHDSIVDCHNESTTSCKPSLPLLRCFEWKLETPFENAIVIEIFCLTSFCIGCYLYKFTPLADMKWLISKDNAFWRWPFWPEGEGISMTEIMGNTAESVVKMYTVEGGPGAHMIGIMCNHCQGTDFWVVLRNGGKGRGGFFCLRKRIQEEKNNKPSINM